MADTTINLIFAAVFGSLAWQSLPRGWRFIRLGYAAIQVNASQPDANTHIERRRDISTGTHFFLAGAGWIIAGIIGALLAVVFAGFAVTGLSPLSLP